MNPDSYSINTADWSKKCRIADARRNVMVASLKVQADYLAKATPYEVIDTADFDAAVLELADALRPASEVPEVIIKIDGELSEDAAMKIQRALNKLHKRDRGIA